MLVKTKAIVISSLKYQEKSLVVKCLTHSDGLKSYFVPNAFAAKNQSRGFGKKIAYFQPLSLLEIEANHKNKGTLDHFKEIKLAHAYQTISTDIVKSTIVMFLSEIIHHSILEEEKNENLFNFLESALLWLDAHDEMANFHLILMLEMTKFFGFYPDNSESVFKFFDCKEGNFTAFQGTNCLSEHETFLFKKLIDLKFDSDQKVFAGTERQILLKILLEYYTIHLDGFKKPKSLDVLKEVFS